ncbi:MAG: hypothetical protein HY360_26045 [Verrucomicrobia bacterium]|nr:hypothetical protein [Verrucomicrobiota bacterium]
MQKNKTLGPTTYPKRHLFLDIDNVVEWDLNVFQNFPKPERLETTGLECGPPKSWDARVAAGWGTVLYDEGKFRGWVCCMPGIGSLKENCDVWLTGYVESEDGIHWHKPDLKITGQKRWPGNNLMKLPGCVMSVVRPLPGAGCKFLALTIQTAPLYSGVTDDGSCEFHGGGTYLFGSDDGLRWRQISKYPMVQHGDWACLHVDHARKRYLLYHKILEHGDEQWLFCGGANRDHGWGIRPDFTLDPAIPKEAQERVVRVFVARSKRDRFASLASNQKSCFDVEIGPQQGDALTINALTRHRGMVRLAVAEQRNPLHLELRKSDSLPGFSFDDCIPFSGDEVKAPVRFRKAKIADLPKDKFLILRFEVSAGEVFEYEWA